jgi:Flp pilus assembly protein TadD
VRCADRFAIGVVLFAALATGCATPFGDRRVSAPSAEKAVAKPAAPVEAPVSPALQQAYDQALAHLKAGRNKEAEQALLALAQRAPELSGPHANLGIVYHRTGRTKEAIEALNRAIRLNPRRAVYYNELGIVYRQEGKFDDARRAYRKALDADPDYALAHLNIAILYDLYLQDPKEALPHYQRYQQLLPAEDGVVAKWIIELERRLRPTASKPPKENG